MIPKRPITAATKTAVEIPALARVYATACANSPKGRKRPFVSIGSRGSRNEASEAITAKYDTALSANAQPGPHCAITEPASAGPTMRAMLNCALLSVTADISVSRGTSSLTNACHAGRFKPLAVPARIDTAT